MIRKDFLEVEGYFPGHAGLESSLVPTKEEYDDFRQRICKALDALESRIAATETVKPDLCTALCSIPDTGLLELTGTEEQCERFSEIRKALDNFYFPKFVPGNKLLKEALDIGLSVKEVKDKSDSYLTL